jgi:mRNA-degrading endonuclease RelE of RelBE toxin-antitoxin system
MASPKIVVEWPTEARADVRRIDRATAMQVLYCLTRYLKTGVGDVKKLQPPRTEFRLRCADYRVFFVLRGENAIAVTGVENRKEAYR